MTRYVIITPVRDEEKLIAATIDSVTRQTIPPVEWVIVDDGSTDGTGSVIHRYASQHHWIHAIHRTNRGFRKSGGGVVEAFYEGYHALRCDDWEFIVKLDGDLALSPDYFQQCFERFSGQPRLGIGGGGIYHDVGGELRLEANPKFHVRGATKIYRRACWNAIGGLWRDAGWDTIDEVKANMLGWKTCTFEDLRVLHHRPTGTADGRLRDKVKHGVACYVSGYHPLFVAASCLCRLPSKPYIIGSAGICYGYLKAHVLRAPRILDTRFISYIRGQQLKRLCGLESIWR